MMRHVPSCAAALVGSGLFVSNAQAQGPQRPEYQQSPAVSAHFDNAPLDLRTPALAPGKQSFTSQEELQAFLHKLSIKNNTVSLRVIGKSLENRDIFALVFSNEGAANDSTLTRSNKPIVWLIGQQHGDEPAGGEAMLAVAQALLEGELRSVLNQLIVVIVPRANPDGAVANRRTNDRGIDINRDHLTLQTPEARALANGMRELPPDVVGDFHEFLAAGPWVRRLRLTPAHDITYLYPTHPMVAKGVTELADKTIRPALERAFNQRQISHGWYFTSDYSHETNSGTLGGTAPTIARNRFGLGHAVSYLFETRGLDLGRQNFPRRVASHYVAARALLQISASQSARVRDVVLQARQDTTRARDKEIALQLQSAIEPWTIPMLDINTADPREHKLQLENTLKTQAVTSRNKPLAYAIAGNQTELVKRLFWQGLTIKQLVEPARLDVEVMRFVDKTPDKASEKPSDRPADKSSERQPERPAARRTEAATTNELTVELTPRNTTLAAGTYIIPMQQPLANVAALALEADSPHGFVTAGLIPVDRTKVTFGNPGVELPVMRVIKPLNAPLKIVTFDR